MYIYITSILRTFGECFLMSSLSIMYISLILSYRIVTLCIYRYTVLLMSINTKFNQNNNKLKKITNALFYTI